MSSTTASNDASKAASKTTGEPKAATKRKAKSNDDASASESGNDVISSSSSGGPKKKKAKKQLHKWGRPKGTKVGDWTSVKCCEPNSIKFDMDTLATSYVGLSDEVLTTLGYPDELLFEDGTKFENLGIVRDETYKTEFEDTKSAEYKAAKALSEKAAKKAGDKILRDRTKTFPPWCFLGYKVEHIPPKKAGKELNLMCITYDGKRVNTPLLMKKIGVLATESAFNKPIKFKITTSMRAKAAALMAFTPDCNGNGKFINLN